MSTTLLLIRHGESKANEKKFFAGHLNVELSEKGKAQAVLTANYVAENYQVDTIYASDLSRAYNTAQPLAFQRNYGNKNTSRNLRWGMGRQVFFRIANAI